MLFTFKFFNFIEILKDIFALQILKPTKAKTKALKKTQMTRDDVLSQIQAVGDEATTSKSAEIKKPKGRPKGSRNIPKVVDENAEPKVNGAGGGPGGRAKAKPALTFQ